MQWINNITETPCKNDIDRLKLCGTGIAVENAISDVRNIVDHITLTNDEDGVAVWLEKNVLSHLGL